MGRNARLRGQRRTRAEWRAKSAKSAIAVAERSPSEPLNDQDIDFYRKDLAVCRYSQDPNAKFYLSDADFNKLLARVNPDSEIFLNMRSLTPTPECSELEWDELEAIFNVASPNEWDNFLASGLNDLSVFAREAYEKEGPVAVTVYSPRFSAFLVDEYPDVPKAIIASLTKFGDTYCSARPLNNKDLKSVSHNSPISPGASLALKRVEAYKPDTEMVLFLVDPAFANLITTRPLVRPPILF